MDTFTILPVSQHERTFRAKGHMHYYSFHIGDYRAATAHLSNAEDLAYRRLIDMYYDSEKPIPLDTEWVARRIRVDADVVHTVLKDMFVVTNDGWRMVRCDDEIQRYHRNAEKNKANGSKGGRPAKNPVGSQPEPKPKATNNHKPTTNNDEPSLKTTAPKRASQLDAAFKPSQEHFNLALSLGIDVPSEMAKFTDYHRAKGSTMKDWDAALRTWIRNAAEFSKGKPVKKSGYVHDLRTMDYTKGVDEHGNF